MSWAESPSLSSGSGPPALSRMRSTADSPSTSGSTLTRMSISRSSSPTLTRPSCGRRRSEMSSSARILMREITPGTMRGGDDGRVAQHAVDAEADAQARVVGIEVDVRRALVDGLGQDRADEGDRGRVLGGGAQVVDLDDLRQVRQVVAYGVADRRVETVHAADEDLQVLGRDHGRHDAVPGAHREVVDRHDVRRLRHRDDERLVVAEAHGHRARTARDVRADEVQGGDVDLEAREVQVVQAEALRHGVRELGVRDQPTVDEDLAHRLSEGAGVDDRRLDHLPGHHARVDEHVAEQAPRARAPGIARRGRHGGGGRRDALRRVHDPSIGRVG